MPDMTASEIPHHQSQSKEISESILRILAEGSVAIVATVIESAHPAVNVGAKLLTSAGNQTVGGLGSKDLDQVVNEQAKLLLRSGVSTRVLQVKEFAPLLTDLAESKILFERIELEPRLVICGAGHVGASLAKLASLMGYRATLIDDRAEFVAPALFANTNIELVCAQSWPAAIVDAAGNGHGVSVAIVTRGHSEDEQCLRAVIDLDVDYIGMIGSKRRTKIVLDRLREDADETRLARVHAPVGLDIGAVTPEEVALAIMAEIVAVRRGGNGGFLYLRRKTQREP
jgi:xanthine dehydrogenase accessory factor